MYTVERDINMVIIVKDLWKWLGVCVCPLCSIASDKDLKYSTCVYM